MSHYFDLFFGAALCIAGVALARRPSGADWEAVAMIVSGAGIILIEVFR